jgi:hypothetical protein
MNAKNVTIDNFNDGIGSRTIRAQLRLGDMWIVESKTVISDLPEHSDEFPDSPDGSFGNWVNGTLGDVVIRISAKRGRLYKCPGYDVCVAHMNM